MCIRSLKGVTENVNTLKSKIKSHAKKQGGEWGKGRDLGKKGERRMGRGRE